MGQNVVLTRLGLSASETSVGVQHMVRLFGYNSVYQRKIITARTTKIIDHSAKALRVAFLALSASHQARGLTP
jgi:hypothetical protein